MICCYKIVGDRLRPQKDMLPFQGSDSREFWQRAEERNAATADLLKKMLNEKYKEVF